MNYRGSGTLEFLRQLLDANLPLHQGNPLLKCTAYPVARLILSHLVRELGIAIPLDATPQN